MNNVKLDLRDSVLYFQTHKVLKLRRCHVNSHGEIQNNPNHLVLRRVHAWVTIAFLDRQC